MNKIEQLRKRRFLFIHTLYEKTGGNEYNDVNERDIGKELNFTMEEIDTISQYLLGEGLIQYTVQGGLIAITHEGVVEVENALSMPDQPTHYFPAVNIITIQHMEDSQIQQGTIESIQKGTFKIENQERLIEFINLLKSKLPALEISDDDKSEIDTDIATIDVQMKSKRPKTGIIKESLLSIKRILEGASGAIVASELLKYIPILLGG